MAPLADSATDKINENVHHLTWSLGPLTVNGDTIFVTGIACGVLLLFALAINVGLRRDRPGRFVSALEAILDFVSSLVKDTLGDRAGNRALRLLGPLAVSLFMFLLVSNLLGLVPTLHSPTNDVNTALALALVSIGYLHFTSIRVRGGRGYVKHYFSVVEPKWFPIGWLPRTLFFLLEVIQELSRPVTLTFRLYFNIFVGELLLLLIVVLFPTYLAPLQFPLGVVWILFSLFVGGVQAFIFTMLTIAYTAMGSEVHDEHGDHSDDHVGDHGSEAPHALPAAAQQAA